MSIIEALQDILLWSKERPLWQRAALKKICNSKDITEEDVNTFIDACKGRTELVMAMSEEDIQSPLVLNKKVSLKAIHSVQNINALAGDQRLQFYPSGLTIVYGDNGSGKSGYIRILKQVCRARNLKNEKILANIYNEEDYISRAKINFVVNDCEQEIEWVKGESTNNLLSAVSVFDSATASIHVDATNDVAYVPFPMQLLKKLADICLEIKKKLQDEVDSLKQKTPTVLKTPSCSQNTSVHQLINNLSSKTSIQKIEILSTLSDSEEKRLAQVQIDLVSDQDKITREYQVKLSKLKDLIKRKGNIELVISNQQHEDLKILKTNYLAYRDAAIIAAKNSFNTDPLPGVGGETWKTLWESAKLYSEKVAYQGQKFPVLSVDSNCVLCQQQLQKEALIRIERFQNFITDDISRKEQESLIDYNRKVGIIKSNLIPIKDIKNIVSFIEDELSNKDLANEIRIFLLKANWRLRSLYRLYDLPEIPLWPESEINKEINIIENYIKNFTSDNAIKARFDLTFEKETLEDRKWLNTIKTDVIEEIERKKQIEFLEDLIKRETSTSQITSKSTAISKKLVTNALRALFSKEVDNMKIGSLAIELKREKSSYGTPQFKVALTRKPSEKVGQVLSEGEFRCVALAAFLTELATEESHSSIILDDPVSSLDHRHREAVAERLAIEGLNRQVIVFTHNIEFLFLLEEACRNNKVQVSYRHITKRPDNSATGLCHNDAPPKAQSVNKSIKSIESRLENEKFHHTNGDNAKWEALVRDLQRELRFTWERAVEDILSVVLCRFSNKVNTIGLPQLTALNLENCKKMRISYGKISRWLHSEGVGLDRNLPNPDNVQEEIVNLKDWHENLKNTQSNLSRQSKNF